MRRLQRFVARRKLTPHERGIASPHHRRHKVAFESQTSTDVNAFVPVPVYLVRCLRERVAPTTPSGAKPRRTVALALDGRSPTSLLLTKWATRQVILPTDDVQLVYKPTKGEESPKAVVRASPRQAYVLALLNIAACASLTRSHRSWRSAWRP